MSASFAGQQGQKLRLGDDGDAQQGGAFQFLRGNAVRATSDKVGGGWGKIAGQRSACQFDKLSDLCAGDVVRFAGEHKAVACKGLRVGGGVGHQLILSDGAAA